MAKYRAAMTVFGLKRDDVFESDDPRWEDHVKAGNVIEVGVDTDLTVLDEERHGDKITIDPDATILGKEELQQRLEGDDEEPVKPGEVGVLDVPSG